MDPRALLIAAILGGLPLPQAGTTLSGQSTLDYFPSRHDRAKGIYLFSGGQ